MKNTLLVILAALLFPAAVPAQVEFSGQSAVQLFKSAPTQSQRSVNNGRTSFGLEADVFVDGKVNENVAGLINARIADNGYISFEYIAIRLANMLPLGMNLQAGKFDLPFGNLNERRFPRKNPLYGLPVIYEYRTALPDRVPTESEILSRQSLGVGMRLLEGGMYDLGVMLFGSAGIVDYAFALSSGTISKSAYGGNTAGDLGKVLRMAVTPAAGFTIGGSFAWGAYLEEPAAVLPRAIDVHSYNERAAELDIEYSCGHLVFYGEGVSGAWQVPLATRDEEFKILGFYLEGKYTIMPRLYAALRLSGLRFGNVLLQGADQPWDADVTEWEGGFGYFLDRDVLVKLVRRETRLSGPAMPKDNLTVLQLVVAY
jgi:hypothetical protein